MTQAEYNLALLDLLAAAVQAVQRLPIPDSGGNAAGTTIKQAIANLRATLPVT